jgi:uncharacterized protein (TIGR02996 family)
VTDERALLAAIAADPADDTARLVYADCLEEHGNAARAEFIRLQIEAERLHSDSNSRARLEEQAQLHFAEHWVDWWGEVCDAVGFLAPVRKPTGTVGRLVQRGLRTFAGYPYKSSQFHVATGPGTSQETRFGGWTGTTFSRGFPDSVSVSLPLASPERNFLHRWLRISPLMKLHAIAPYTEQWIDGPHLAGLRSLTLEDYDQVVLHGVLNSPHLVNLDELVFRVPDYREVEHARFAGELEQALHLPRARQLKRLSLPLWTDRAAEVLANAVSLAGLEALDIDLYPPLVLENHFRGIGALALDDDIGRIAVLARSPYLSGLRELKIAGMLNPEGIAAIFQKPTWTGLRKLDIHVELGLVELDPMTRDDHLQELEELRLSCMSYSVAVAAVFARSHLLKRLRHFAVRGPYSAVDFDIADAVDVNRIETFAIESNLVSPRVARLLRDRFGDRLKLLD